MPVRGDVLKSSNTSLFEVFVARFAFYDLSGAIYHPASGSCWNFNGILHMVNILEQYLDEFGFPQKTNVIRSFDKRLADAHSKLLRLGSIIAGKGVRPMEKPTFIVRIQYRQNATWQGSIQWVEEKKTQQFRSVLEMIRLMEEAIESNESAAGQPGWNSES